MADTIFYYTDGTSSTSPNTILSASSKNSLKILESVIIGSAVTNINQDAFAGATRLTTINIPNNVTVIQNGAFQGCTNLATVSIGSGLTTIDAYTFWNCTSLTNISIGINVTSIGNNAFENCSNLISINIPDNVITLGSNIFRDCTKLTFISIGSGVANIGTSAFNNNCPKLENIIVNISNPNFSSENGILYNKNKTKILTYPSGKIETIFSIPTSVTIIGNTAFAQCVNLINILIPNSVTLIESSTFFDCINLDNVNIPNSVISIGAFSFSNCINLKNIILSNNITTIGQGTFQGCINLAKIVIPNKVASIQSFAFQNCANLIEMNCLGDGIFFDYNSLAGTNVNLKIYRYSIKSGWPTTVQSKPVELIDRNVRGLKTFGFLSNSNGNLNFKKQYSNGKFRTGKLNQTILLTPMINPPGGVILGGNIFSFSVEVNTVVRFSGISSSGLQVTILYPGGGAYPNQGNVTAPLGFQDIVFTEIGSYVISATQPGNPFYRSATKSILVLVVPPTPTPTSSGSSGFGVGGGGV